MRSTGTRSEKKSPISAWAANSIIREVEVCISMNLTVAKVFRDWLDSKIKSIEEIKGTEPEQVK